MNRIILLSLLLLTLFSSCKVVPFFIPKESLQKREADKVERLAKRKEQTEKKIARKEKNKKTPKKRTIKKLDKLENKLPSDTVVSGLDSASLAQKKEKVEDVVISKEYENNAQKILAASAIDYETVKLKTKISYNAAGKNQKFNAQFRIDKDKTIWVSISVVALEVARAVVTPDSVIAYDRINKKYYQFTFDQIVKLINIDVDFKTLQNIIVGDAIGSDGQVFEFDDFGGTVNLGLRSKEYLNKLTFNKSDSTLRQIQLQLFRGEFASKILGMLGEYEKENKRYIAKKRIYNIEDSRGSFNLEIEVNKADFDEKLSMPFMIPPKYEPAIIE
jgi:hypothetical protein